MRTLLWTNQENTDSLDWEIYKTRTEKIDVWRKLSLIACKSKGGSCILWIWFGKGDMVYKQNEKKSMVDKIKEEMVQCKKEKVWRGTNIFSYIWGNFCAWSRKSELFSSALIGGLGVQKPPVQKFNIPESTGKNIVLFLELEFQKVRNVHLAILNYN